MDTEPTEFQTALKEIKRIGNRVKDGSLPPYPTPKDKEKQKAEHQIKGQIIENLQAKILEETGRKSKLLQALASETPQHSSPLCDVWAISFLLRMATEQALQSRQLIGSHQKQAPAADKEEAVDVLAQLKEMLQKQKIPVVEGSLISILGELYQAGARANPHLKKATIKRILAQHHYNNSSQKPDMLAMLYTLDKVGDFARMADELKKEK